MFSIETWEDNKILRTVSEKIHQKDLKQFVKLWKEMIKYIKNPKNWGVWLAAPQIWYNNRLIVVSLMKDWDDEDFQTVMMINPEILKFSDEKDTDYEWCLSVPGWKWKVERSHSIKLNYIDHKWHEKTLILKWLSARIVQHEVDHLNWVLFTDRINEPSFNQKNGIFI